MIKVMPEDKLPLSKTIVFSFQQLFACFGATILVPLLVGLPSSVALFSAGCGTIIYLACTRFKVPLFLGSSFAFLPALFMATNGEATWGSIAVAMFFVGLFYAVVSFVISKVGSSWLDKVLPPVIMGSVIITIGLNLAPIAVQNALYDLDGNYHLYYLVITLITIGTIAFVGTLAKGYFKAIPILCGLIVGYVFTLIMGFINPEFKLLFYQGVADAPWFTLPLGPAFLNWEFNPAIIAVFLIISLATLTEHLGDVYAISGIVGREFYKNPGISKTILGDGLATAFAGLTGSVPNVSYGECSATQALSKVHSIRVILGAALVAIILSFFGKFSALIGTIPSPVLNGACFVLFGMIASVGLKTLVKAGIDYDNNRNLIISSVILTSGIGGATLRLMFGDMLFSLSGVAFGVVIGIILNLVLPGRKTNI